MRAVSNTKNGEIRFRSEFHGLWLFLVRKVEVILLQSRYVLGLQWLKHEYVVA